MTLRGFVNNLLVLFIVHKKLRADTLMVEQDLAPSRTRAQSLILSGSVYEGTNRIEKPGQLISKDSKLVLKSAGHPYASRGGVKLKSAIDHFKISVSNCVCLDVGASTGGFTDCLLKEGAKKVYAVDVGYGQLDWSLRNDPRVVVIERTNFRYFDTGLLADAVDIATVDVSFISLAKIIPKVKEVLLQSLSFCGKPKTMIALVKPQFEVGKQNVGKKGIVRDRKKQLECVEKIKKFCEKEGLKTCGVLPSPISGQKGNQEYLLVAEYAKDDA